MRQAEAQPNPQQSPQPNPALDLQALRRRLVRNAYVLWPYRGRVEEGQVLFVRGDAVDVIWLEGYQSRNDTVPLTDILSVHDKAGPQVELFPFSGKGWLTEAGLAWQQAHPRD